MRRNSRSRQGLWPLALLLLLLEAGGASAHVANLSTSRLDVSEAGIRQVVDVHRKDLEAALGIPLAAAGETTDGDVAAEADRARDYLLAKAGLAGTDGAACAVTPDRPRHIEDHVLLTATWRCPAGARLDYRVTLFHELDPNARHLALVVREGGEPNQHLLTAGQAVVILDTPAAWHRTLARHLASGIEHIAIGFDHIAFLLALLLWARRFWPFVGIVTAFTVAHSITLSLAALDLVRLPAAWVEPLIALTIVWAAAENFFSTNGANRWRTAFPLGLLHGFGFASVLAGFELPGNQLILALAGFNLGVEAGQLIIVAVLFPLLLALDRATTPGGETPGRSPRLVRALSLPILLLGVYWFAERTVL